MRQPFTPNPASLYGQKHSQAQAGLIEARARLAAINRELDTEWAIEEGLPLPVPEGDAAESAGSLAKFMQLAWSSLEPGQPLIWGWALDAICDHLQAVTKGYIKRLIITVPPGMSKSVSTCVYWPAWEWGPYGRPDLKHLTFSYNIELSKRDNRRCRMLINSEWYNEHWGDQFNIAADQNEKANFENTKTGWRRAAGIGGQATGLRADRVIIDDPLNVKDGNSEAALMEAIRFTDETLPTRLINPATSAIVWIMQRVHEKDPVGHLLRKELGYVHLMLPMEFEPARRCVTVKLPDSPNDEWREHGFEDQREQEGELLFPGRFPQEVVDELKKSMGSYAWAGQAQQRPAPRGGGMLKTELIEIVKAVPAGAAYVRSWDLAASDAKGTGDPDWTRGVLCALYDGVFFLCNLRSIRAGPGKVESLVKQTAALDGIEIKVRIPQDPGQAGKALAQRYLKTVLFGYAAYAEIESGDKATRADPMAAAIEAGNVKMVEGDWNEAVIDEFGTFPFGSHDDIVDGAAAGFNFLAARPSAPVVTSPLMEKGEAYNQQF